jgi:transposase
MSAGATGPGEDEDAAVRLAIARLDEIPGISRHTAQVILAGTGPGMSRFPAAGHLVSWAKLSHRTIQSGAKSTPDKTGKGNPYLKGALGEAAAAAARTGTFLGERYRRIVRRRGKLRALVAVARSILVIVWHLLAGPAARFRDLGAGHYASRTDTGRKTRNHVRQLEALGFTTTLARRLIRITIPTRLRWRSAGCCRALAGVIFRSEVSGSSPLSSTRNSRSGTGSSAIQVLVKIV